MLQTDTRLVLVVDDDFISRRLLESALSKNQYRVVCASGVSEAKDLLKKDGFEAFSAIVTDFRMPELTGLDLLNWLEINDPTIGSIMVTAEGEKRLVAESMRARAVDFLEKPVEMRRLMKAVDRAIAETNDRRKSRVTQNAVKDLGAAQSALLKAPVREEFRRILVCHFPMHEAGGDFYTALPLDNGRIGVLLADVSGHDLRSAFVGAFFQGMARGLTAKSSSIGDVFRHFSRILAEEWNQPAEGKLISSVLMSVAACGLEFDPSDNSVRLCNCGAPRPALVTPDGLATLIGQWNSPLGWEYPLTATDAGLPEAEGHIFFWTDGLDDLATTLKCSPAGLVTDIFKKQALGQRPDYLQKANDDIMAVRVCLGSDPLAEPDFMPLHVDEISGNEANRIDSLQEAWADSIRRFQPDLDESTAFDLLLATREVVLNGLVHGCADSAEKAVRLSICWNQKGSFFRVSVEDPGAGHDFPVDSHEVAASAELMTSHRGLIFIKHLATRLETRRRGAHVIMDFHSGGN